jgi:hypothetical protein
MAEVGVHDDDEVARAEVQAVNVGGTEAELAGAGLELDMRGVGFDELGGNFLGAIGRAIVDNDQLPVELAEGKLVYSLECAWRNRACLSVKVRLRSQVMIGRFLRSLYVGKMTEYLLPVLGAILKIGRMTDQSQLVEFDSVGSNFGAVVRAKERG